MLAATLIVFATLGFLIRATKPKQAVGSACAGAISDLTYSATYHVVGLYFWMVFYLVIIPAICEMLIKFPNARGSVDVQRQVYVRNRETDHVQNSSVWIALWCVFATVPLYLVVVAWDVTSAADLSMSDAPNLPPSWEYVSNSSCSEGLSVIVPQIEDVSGCAGVCEALSDGNFSCCLEVVILNAPPDMFEAIRNSDFWRMFCVLCIIIWIFFGANAAAFLFGYNPFSMARLPSQFIPALPLPPPQPLVSQPLPPPPPLAFYPLPPPQPHPPQQHRSRPFSLAPWVPAHPPQFTSHEAPSQCSICFESIQREDASYLPCSHVFHLNCIGRWAAATCPMCRASTRTYAV